MAKNSTTNPTKQAAKLAALSRGEQGEELAADHYRTAGYKIVARNWRCFEGEIDIIAVKGRSIVICEVKTRSARSRMDPALTITPAKQAKVRTAAYRWLEETKPQGRVRFDVALVVDQHVQLLEGAF